MKKSTSFILSASMVLITSVAFAGCQQQSASVQPTSTPTPAPTAIATPLPTALPTDVPTPSPATSPLNATYIIDGKPVTLVNGKASTPAAPGSASMVTTTVWGTPKTGNLNVDTLADSALILTQNMGGSGEFFYVAAAINQDGKYLGTNAELLGDRIAMQTMVIRPDKLIEVNYAVRPEGAAETDKASEAVSSYFKVTGLKLTPAENPNTMGN